MLSDETRDQLRHLTVAPGDVDLARFPDFMIVGPQRTGTTWLYRNLQHHPHVRLPLKKETYYFSTLDQPDHPRFQFPTLQDYLELFRDSPKRIIKRNYDSLRRSFTPYRPKITGEATATYATLSPEVIREITLLNPGIKIILMLRDPIDRAWSHAKKDYRKKGQHFNHVPLPDLKKYFARTGQQRLADYPTMIKNWAQHLKPAHLFLATFEQLNADAPALLTATCQFLGIPSSPRYFYSRHLEEKINPTAASKIPEDIHAYLFDHFAAESTAYQNLLTELSDSQRTTTGTAVGYPVTLLGQDPSL